MISVNISFLQLQENKLQGNEGLHSGATLRGYGASCKHAARFRRQRYFPMRKLSIFDKKEISNKAAYNCSQGDERMQNFQMRNMLICYKI